MPESRTVIGMGTVGFTIAAAAVGALVGVLSVRSLRTLRYRRDDEVALPRPDTAWVLPTAVLAAVILTIRLAPNHPSTLILLAPLTVAGPWLAAVDLDVHRLPDRVIGPVAASSLVALLLVSTVRTSSSMLVLGAAGLVLAGGGYFALHLIGRGALGFGDVKLAAIIGLTLGALGLGTLWWSLLLSSVLCLIWFVVAKRRKHSSTRVAFGPWMLLGSLVAAAAFGT